jgi:glycosyltransferase involved in cell wall biosynthesis
VTPPTRRVVYNALPLDARGGGVSTYIRELLAAMTEVAGATGIELAAAVRPSGRAELPPGVTPLIKRESDGVARALTGAMGFGPCALVHGLDVDLPLRRRGLSVCTVHDMAIFDVPSTFPRTRVAGERILMRHAIRRADAVVADSAFTAGRIRALLGREATVIHLAPGTGMAPPSVETVDEVRSRYGLPDQFVLHVGNIEPRKDIPTLAEACRLTPLPLVLTGHSLWGHQPPAGAIEIGHVPVDDLPGLYGSATLVGYASRYEGFGLPPIEAMACGAPVVTTPVPAVTELVGDGAELFTPGDVGGLTGTLRRLVGDPSQRAELARRGAERVRPLSWRRTAEETASLYRSLGLDL